VVERIKACLNGQRDRREHPGVPVTPAELATAAAEAVAAGAEAVHVHPRGSDGVESLHADDIGTAVSAIRRLCPDTPVGVSTGLWITGGDPEARGLAVARWASLPAAARPDFASFNVGEPGFAALAALLELSGISPEAGVWTVADAEALVEADGIDWLRILVEVGDAAAGEAVAEADAILRRLDELDVPGPRLLHGAETAAWPLIGHAGRLGLPTRIGLEDATTGPDGEPVTGNGDLVRRALVVWTRARPR
jgi:uncharacterized protein (DUF849 family)